MKLMINVENLKEFCLKVFSISKVFLTFYLLSKENRFLEENVKIAFKEAPRVD